MECIHREKKLISRGSSPLEGIWEVPVERGQGSGNLAPSCGHGDSVEHIPFKEKKGGLGERNLNGE